MLWQGECEKKRDGWSWEVVREVGEVVINHMGIHFLGCPRILPFFKVRWKAIILSNDSRATPWKIDDRGTGQNQGDLLVVYCWVDPGETSRWWGLGPRRRLARSSEKWSGSQSILKEAVVMSGNNEWEELKTKFLVSFNWQTELLCLSCR